MMTAGYPCGVCRTVVRAILMVLILLGAVPSAAAQTETIEYYGLDALGSVRVIVDPTGQLIDRMDYGPFGENLKAAINMAFEQYAQLSRDAETGQDYARARNYTPSTGRFNRVDPVYAGLFDPQRWNRYTYASNNPASLTDPTGLCPECPPYIETVNVVGKASPVPAGIRGLPGGGTGDDLMLTVEEQQGIGGSGMQILLTSGDVDLPPKQQGSIEFGLMSLVNSQPSQQCDAKILQPLGISWQGFTDYLANGAVFFDGTKSKTPTAGGNISTTSRKVIRQRPEKRRKADSRRLLRKGSRCERSHVAHAANSNGLLAPVGCR